MIEPDDRLRSDPELSQVAGELTSACIELPVGQVRVLVHDRDRIGRPLGLLLEKPMDA